ncbi:hypothetical protein HCU40_01605 [Pseudanabaena biceps]|nr:hypothetical protein [Pseudanabaena biceps]
MESLESILDQLQNKYKEPDSPQPLTNSKPDSNEDKRSHSQAPQVSPSNVNSLDKLLDELRGGSLTYKSGDRQLPHSNSEIVSSPLSHAPSLAIARDLQEVAHQQMHKDQEMLVKTATAWLEKLDPLCGEGLWFAEFAKNYTSQLEAAIALLQS